MKKILFLIMILTVFAMPMNLLAAQVKIKHFGSIYTDAEGGALREPSGVSYRDGLLMVADSGSKSILTYSYQGGEVMPVDRFSLPGMFPLMVQRSAAGDLYVLDGRERQIYILDPSGRSKGKFTPQGLPDKRRIVPRSFRISNDGTILVLDIFSERVLVFDSNGAFQRQVKFSGQTGSYSDVISDKEGTVYLLESVDAVIYKAVSGAEIFEPLTSSMKENMNFPTSLAIDIDGNLFLIDKHGSGLAIVDASGSFVGRRLSMGWKESHLYYPSQISISEKGDIFVADKGNNRIQHFMLSE